MEPATEARGSLWKLKLEVNGRPEEKKNPQSTDELKQAGGRVFSLNLSLKGLSMEKLNFYGFIFFTLNHPPDCQGKNLK